VAADPIATATIYPGTAQPLTLTLDPAQDVTGWTVEAWIGRRRGQAATIVVDMDITDAATGVFEGEIDADVITGMAAGSWVLDYHRIVSLTETPWLGSVNLQRATLLTPVVP
jgi:hypothetical protein